MDLQIHNSHFTATSDIIDVTMSDANDEQLAAARLRDETAQLLASLSSYPSHFAHMTTFPNPPIDDVTMADVPDPYSPPKVIPPSFQGDASKTSAGNGKGIFNYLERAFEAPGQQQQQKLQPVYNDTSTPTVTADPYPNFTNTTNLASLVKRSAPSESSLDLPKRRCLSHILPLSSKPATPLPQASNISSTPRELRDQIYNLALLNTEENTDMPKEVNLDKILLPGLCGVSRTIYHETLPIYFAVNRFKTHLHMPHTYEHALDPISHHESYLPAALCSLTVKKIQESKDTAKFFAAREITFDVLDKDQAHFCTLEIKVWKRGGGGVAVKCEGGSEVGCEVVAESERVMIEGMKDLLEPIILGMTRRVGFEGLTLDDLQTVASKVVVPWKAEDEGMDEGEGKTE